MAEENERGRCNFPTGFAWGCGTSPTQIEGEIQNEWAEFTARDGSRPDDGPNHWRRYRYDFRCLEQLNLNAYRLGFDWGRLQPGPNAPFDREVSYRYLEMLAELRSRKIEPYLTLFHFACPKWLALRGGWLNPEAPLLFADFADRVAEMTDGEVRFWITHNEPAVYALMAYVMGEFPPAKKGQLRLALKVLKNLQIGHALAAERIKKRLPEAQVGITKHFKDFVPHRSWHPLDRLMTFGARRLFDRLGLDGFIRRHGRLVSDFVGVNFYGRLRMRGFTGLSPITGYSHETLEKYGLVCDEMWEQAPEYLPRCLAEVAQRTGLPVYVTENGFATRDEAQREQWLREHLGYCHQAIAAGVDLRGYFYWSLLDNFEWGEGLTKPFGLMEVDFGDPERRRKIRRSGRVYGRIAETNVLSWRGAGE